MITRDEEFCGRLNNSATFRGFTALHYAVLSDSYDTVKILLEGGANPIQENDSGHRPEEYTTDPEIKKVLQEYANKVRNLFLISLLPLFTFFLYIPIELVTKQNSSI